MNNTFFLFVKMMFFIFFVIFPGTLLTAQELDDLSYMEDSVGEPIPADVEKLAKVVDSPGDNDPLESLNRVIFGFNEAIDTIFINPIAWVYTTIFPESLQLSFEYILRNMNEPIVFVNNVLQGDGEGARITLGRFLINSTIGLGGALNVADYCDLPYKKEDFGQTLASWGVDPGPYMVIPLLGPSNGRDTLGRVGDFLFDPINWWTFFTDNVTYGTGRTGGQILAARAGNLSIFKRLQQDSLDYYATTRTWYSERREALRRRNIPKSKAETLESPVPDDD